MNGSAGTWGRVHSGRKEGALTCAHWRVTAGVVLPLTAAPLAVCAWGRTSVRPVPPLCSGVSGALVGEVPDNHLGTPWEGPPTASAPCFGVSVAVAR